MEAFYISFHAGFNAKSQVDPFDFYSHCSRFQLMSNSGWKTLSSNWDIGRLICGLAVVNDAASTRSGLLHQHPLILHPLYRECKLKQKSSNYFIYLIFIYSGRLSEPRGLMRETGVIQKWKQT